MGGSLNIATLRIEGEELALADLSVQLPGRLDKRWIKGDRRRSGGIFEQNGFSVIVAEEGNPLQLMNQVRTFLRTCSERKIEIGPNVSAELSFGIGVGESEQFLAALEWTRQDLRALAEFGALVSVTAYPASDEEAENRLGAQHTCEASPMVFFVVTRAGYEQLLLLANPAPSPLWVGRGVLTESEVKALHASGANVTVFDYAIDPKDASAIEGALHTIAQHHPEQRVWVEREGEA